jgi:hypothetical protein
MEDAHMEMTWENFRAMLQAVSKESYSIWWRDNEEEIFIDGDINRESFERFLSGGPMHER